MKNIILNSYSVLVGKVFAFSYALFPSEHKMVLAILDHYIATRRMLPRMECGKHFGNHDGSDMRPFLATQAE
jgi:hypothetical protein